MKELRRDLLRILMRRPEGELWVLMGNGSMGLALEPKGCMTPLFGGCRGNELVNAHWRPAFACPDSEERAQGLLGHISGEFPCCPEFGPGSTVRGTSIPAHGWTANEEWSVGNLDIDNEAGIATCVLSLESPAPELPLSWTRRVCVLSGQSAYYSVLSIRNRGADALSVNLGHHNVVGKPFLEPGCRISLAADKFMVAPEGTEFDATGRLVMGAEFENLAAAPLRTGGSADLSLVPGIVGRTDFVTGAISDDLSLGWSCVTNPRLGIAYISFFPGAKGLPEGEVALSFNDLWMQYGGRRFKPWAPRDGAEDLTFCLGAENATGAFANGLAYSLEHPELLGLPTTVEIPARGERRLCYGTAMVGLKPDLLGEGVTTIEAEGSSLVVKAKKAYQRLDLDGSFERIRLSIDMNQPSFATYSP